MALKIVTVPCRQDNYAYLLHNPDTDQTAIVDFPQSEPLLAALEAHGWVPSQAFITHHHGDHVEGLSDVLKRFPMTVIGHAADAQRLPALDQPVSEGDVIDLCGHEAHILDVSGHTIGHIAAYLPQANAVFTADSLMALGCGRVFEGTMEQMWASLSKLAALPPETYVYSGHEYTAANAKFALTVEPDNAELLARVKDISEKRAKDEPTVPSKLGLELATNPFLRAGDRTLRSALGMDGATDAEVFAEVRRRKDNF